MIAKQTYYDGTVQAARWHSVETFGVGVSVSIHTETDSYGDQSQDADGRAEFLIKATCGAEFTTDEIRAWQGSYRVTCKECH